MTPIEKKKLELELLKVGAAKAELEFKIMEREEDIGRIKSHIKIQDDKIEELKKLLEAAE